MTNVPVLDKDARSAMLQMAVVLLLLTGTVEAAPIRLCYSDRPRPPFLLPEGQGSVPDLIREAAKNIGQEVIFANRPTRRCLEQIRQGEMDGHPAVPITPALQQDFVFPKEITRNLVYGSTMHNRIMLYRRARSNVSWDGRSFSGLSRPVLIYVGAELPRAKLQAMGVGFEENTQRLEQLFAKLLAGRAELAVGWESDGNTLLHSSNFEGKIEVLPVAFIEADYYFSVSQQYWKRNEKIVVALWAAIERVRESRLGRGAK